MSLSGTLCLVINALTPDEAVLKSSISSPCVTKRSNIALFTSESANKMQPPVVLLGAGIPDENHNEAEPAPSPPDRSIRESLQRTASRED